MQHFDLIMGVISAFLGGLSLGAVLSALDDGIVSLPWIFFSIFFSVSAIALLRN